MKDNSGQRSRMRSSAILAKARKNGLKDRSVALLDFLLGARKATVA